MKFLPQSFTVLEYCGAWPSPQYYSGWKKIFYNCYTLLVVTSILLFCLIVGIEFGLSCNLNEYVKSGCMLFTFIVVCSKIAVVLLRRKHIIQVFDSVQTELCKAQNEEEEKIANDWDPHLSLCLQGFRALVICELIVAISSSIIKDSQSRKLHYGKWFPSNYTGDLGYWIALLHQNIAFGWCGLIGTTTDAVIYGVMMQTCAQLKILKCRLRKLAEIIEAYSLLINNVNNNKNKDIIKQEKKMIKKCLSHHLLILRYATKCNDIFAIVIFLQFTVSALILCMSTQSLTKMKLMSSEFVFIVMYIISILIKIFLYCWYGNEVIFESSDIYMAIYEMNWEKLSPETHKDLLIIMTRSMYPIEFTSGHIAILSINSYNALMKLSYTMYSVLSQSA